MELFSRMDQEKYCRVSNFVGTVLRVSWKGSKVQLLGNVRAFLRCFSKILASQGN